MNMPNPVHEPKNGTIRRCLIAGAVLECIVPANHKSHKCYNGIVKIALRTMYSQEQKDPHADRFSFTLMKLKDLPNFMAAFDDYQEAVVMDQTMFFDLKICVDEAIANIFNHGYKESKETPRVDVDIYKESNQFFVEITDNSDYFDPYSVHRNPDLTSALEDRKIGGLGIHLIKNLSDSLEYYPLENGNKIIVSKRCIN